MTWIYIPDLEKKQKKKKKKTKKKKKKKKKNWKKQILYSQTPVSKLKFRWYEIARLLRYEHFCNAKCIIPEIYVAIQ